MRIEDETNPTAAWPIIPATNASLPDVGPVADASRRRVSGAHNDRPADSYTPGADGSVPYWQYLERQNRRDGGAAYEAASVQGASEITDKPAGDDDAPSHPEGTDRAREDFRIKGGYRLPSLAEVIDELAAADRAEAANREPSKPKVVREPVVETMGTRVDTVV